MLAALGALVPEILDMLGAFHFVEPVWWQVGYSKLKVVGALHCKISIITHIMLLMLTLKSSCPLNYIS